MSTVVIDGTYQLHRAVYTGKTLESSGGVHTGGIFIFLKMLWNFKDRGDVIVVFDSPGARCLQRRELCPEYKARKPSDDPKKELERARTREALNVSLEVLLDILPKMGFPVVMIPGQEGDDVVFHISKFLKRADPAKQITVVSDDKDYLQFLKYDISVFQPMKMLLWTSADFEKEYGFPVEFFTMYKSVIGDTSDNIMGASGLGPKTATSIMQELLEPSWQALYEWGQSGKKSKHKKVLENFALIKRNMLIIDLDNMKLSEEVVGGSYNAALSNVKYDGHYVAAKFKELDINTLGNWLTYILQRS